MFMAVPAFVAERKYDAIGRRRGNRVDFARMTMV
jgi:hypothetical protein